MRRVKEGKIKGWAEGGEIVKGEDEIEIKK